MEQCFLYNRCNHKDCDKDFCLRKYKLDDLYTNARFSNKQRMPIKLVLDADNTDLAEFVQLKEISANIVDFVSSGTNLFLYSTNCGNGKTSWAIKLVQSYFDQIWPKASLGCHALFIHIPTFLNALKENISSPNEYATYIKDNIMKADIVIWDEVAAKMGSEYECNQLLSFIDGRLALGKSNIYTANSDFKRLQEWLGERLASRICQYSTCIELHGADKRAYKQEAIC